MLTKLIRCILIISIIFSMHKLNAQNYDSLFIGLADIKRGMAIGEIGAGGGDFAIKILQVVGDKGIVYANEISDDAIE